MQSWWQRRSGPSQALLGLLALVVAIGLLLRVLVSVTGGPRAQGPESSSFATSRPGLAAWAELLREYAHPITRLRTSLADASLDNRSTLVVLDSELDVAERFALQDFVKSGGRLIIGGESMIGALGDVLGGGQAYPVTSDDDPVARVDPSALPGAISATGGSGTPVATTNIRRLRVAGSARFSSVSPLRRVATTASGNSVVLRSTVDSADVDDGTGTVLLISDASFLQNRLLGEADNAAFAVALVGEGGVTFAEFGHGYSDRSGLLGASVLPPGWSWFLTGLLLAFLLWTISVGRRIGPARVAHRTLPPPRIRYVDALAVQLQHASRNIPSDPPPARSSEPLPDKEPAA